MSENTRMYVSFTDRQMEQIEKLKEECGHTTKVSVIRNAIRVYYDDQFPPHTRNKGTSKSSNKTKTEDDLVAQEKKKLERKKARKKAKHEQLKEEKADLLDNIEGKAYHVDNADNLWVYFQYYKKRTGPIDSWGERVKVSHLHDELGAIPQYRPDKETVIEEIKKHDGQVLQHSEIEKYDVEPQAITEAKQVD